MDSLDQLPKENHFGVFDLYQWNGFWYRSHQIDAVKNIQSQFLARDDDVILTSSMKTGSTWLKALSLCNMKNQEHEQEDLLAKNHPAFYVRTLESQVFTPNQSPDYDLSALPSPRIFHTHLSYAALPDSIKNTECKLVYITRNPKDTFVSMYHFFNHRRTPEQGPSPVEEAFEKFCNGAVLFGPFFEHVVGYWEESLKNTSKMLFLRYEDLKKDPKEEVKKLAAFLGRPFAEEEEAEEVVRRCSLERLKNMEVNKKGVDPWVNMPNSAYFRKGVVGDWKNLLTDEMSERLDHITKIKLDSSGLVL